MGMEKKMVRVAPPQLGRSLREAEDGLALLGNACREDMPCLLYTSDAADEL